MQIRKAIEICNKMHVRNIDPYLTEKNELKNMLRKTKIKKAVVVGGGGTHGKKLHQSWSGQTGLANSPSNKTVMMV